MIPKHAYETLKKQAAEVEAYDRAAAAELGFAKAAHALGLSEEQYQQFRKIAEQVVTTSQETNAQELKPGTIAEGMKTKAVDADKENVNKDTKTAAVAKKK